MGDSNVIRAVARVIYGNGRVVTRYIQSSGYELGDGTIDPIDDMYGLGDLPSVSESVTGRVVYFVTDNEHVKIGYSSQLRKRMSQLRTSTGRRLRCVLAAPGTYDDEGDLHMMFKPQHLRREWFHASGAMVRLIRRAQVDGLRVFGLRSHADNVEAAGQMSMHMVDRAA